MREDAIQIEGLSKCYRLGERASLNRTFGEMLGHKLGAIVRRGRRSALPRDHLFWALRDINLTVKPGEIVGIIGRNGAGKSTLLKVLSNITDPTTGRARIRGRVSSLLEVGTGFHPELTGHENIALNGAVLGMSRREVRAKRDAIIAFSGVERFLDTPVKRYSSGMRVRLAFAIAAHLDPQVLIVDEVLAVGDGVFQKKCLGKMGEAARDGRTVLLVSHNLHAIRGLCSRVVWLEQGRMRTEGLCADVVRDYIRAAPEAGSAAPARDALAALPPDEAMRLTDIRVKQFDKATDHVTNSEPVTVEVEYEVYKPTAALRLYVDLLDASDQWLFRSYHDSDRDEPSFHEPGRYVSRVVIPADLLVAMPYTLRVGGAILQNRVCTGEAGVNVPLFVQPGGRVNRAYPRNGQLGGLSPLLDWQTRAIEAANRPLEQAA